ncbi:DEKNAAC103098 [Brettanomyces naardenensis]|uniref:phosphoadenylyl-sulfate reductase (thioredoxin) n=1 Tax=Brettanomyces naardenensis TaxID=13370 RepID=A0A448YM85_BRENA|nr:DEKNAAC103098 [Brettanomyces naardenensis]
MTTSSSSPLISKAQLDHLNKALSDLSPEEIIRWAIISFPDLFQTTAFGLSGLCILDIMSKLELPKGLYKDSFHPIQLVFIDTLYHFPQTLDLVEKVKEKYPEFELTVFRPQNCDTEEDFRKKYGDELWEKDQLKYDFLVKVEPLERAYKTLNIKAVFTGRRRSQGAARSQLPVIDIDETMGVIKINPLVNWSFDDVKSYIEKNHVPYNDLLDLGYKSVGDWHSTVPVKEGEDERSGRWKGQVKTECGMHQTSKYAEFLKKEITTEVTREVTTRATNEVS